MFNLVIKDFILLKKMKLLLLVFPMMIAVWGIQMPLISGAMYVMASLIVTYMCVLYANGYDDKNKSEIILNSMPINRSDIVMGKYTTTSMYILISGVITILMTKFIKIIGFSTTARTANVWDLLIVFIIMGMIYSVYYPLYFKFGYDALKYFNTGFYFILIVMPTVLGKFAKSEYGSGMINKLVDSNLNFNKIILLITVCVSIVYLISLLISIGIYNKREF